MFVAAGVSRAGKVLPAMFVDFEIISDLLAVRVITKKQAIRWMCQTKILHTSPVFEFHNLDGESVSAFIQLPPKPNLFPRSEPESPARDFGLGGTHARM
jgi:hypothetical protein